MKDIKQLKKENITILYVEDDQFIQKEISNVLKLITDNVFVASDGLEGLEIAKRENIELIITDINMPNMNGFEMLKHIREFYPDIPAIILSAYSQSEFINEASQIDSINSYLLKPVNIMTLLEKIKINIKKIIERREHKKIDKLLAQYKMAVDNSSIVSKTDKNGIITFVNQLFCDISGYSEEELIGQNHRILRHPDMKKEVFQEMWDTIANKKKIWKGKVKNKKKDGGYYIVQATIIPILDEDNEIEEFISMRTDITELEAYKEILEKELDASKYSISDKIHLLNEYENTINLSAIVIRVSKNLKINFINDKFLEVTKYSKDELIDKYFYDEFLKKYNNADIVKEIIKNNTYKGIIEIESKDKEKKFLEMSFKSILDRSGNIIEYMGIGYDITDTIKLHKEIEETQKDVIFSLGTIGEARSKETGNHVKRVAEYSYILAKLCGLSEHECEVIKIASPMHDIGKVAIPDSILNKPARFTPEEFEIMKTHTTLGYNMLKDSNRELLKASAIVAYTHHEKYDGTGYPRGLKGEDIPIFGRITAIADVFDALGSDRCYKKAWELDRILKMFEEERGKHFDPKLMDLFLDNLDLFLEIRDKYKDEFKG